MGLRLRLVHAGESAWACLFLRRCHVHTGACILIAGIDSVRVPVIAGHDLSSEADTVLVEVIERAQVSVLAGSAVRRTPPEKCEYTPGIRVATVGGVRVSIIARQALSSSADPVLVIVIDRALVSVVAGRAIRPHPAEWCEYTAGIRITGVGCGRFPIIARKHLAFHANAVLVVIVDRTCVPIFAGGSINGPSPGCRVHAGASILIAGIDGVGVPVVAGLDLPSHADTVLVMVIDRAQVSVFAQGPVNGPSPGCSVHAGASILIAGIGSVGVPIIAGPDLSSDAAPVLVEVIERAQVSVFAGSAVSRTPPGQCEHTARDTVTGVDGVRVPIIARQGLASDADTVLVVIIHRAPVPVVAGSAICPPLVRWCEDAARIRVAGVGGVGVPVIAG